MYLSHLVVFVVFVLIISHFVFRERFIMYKRKTNDNDEASFLICIVRAVNGW